MQTRHTSSAAAKRSRQPHILPIAPRGSGRHQIQCLLLAAMLLTGGVAYAGAPGITAKLGTLGVGGDITLPLIPSKLNLRAGYNWLGYEDTVDLGDSDVDGDLDFQTIPILLDWHPVGTGFRLSGGVVINDNQVGMSAEDKVLILDDIAFPVDSLSGDITFNEVAGYVGLGYGNAVGADGHWHFACDFGVMLQGEPQVDAAATSPIPGLQGLLDSALADETDNLEDDLRYFAFYPVIAVGVSVHF